MAMRAPAGAGSFSTAPVSVRIAKGSARPVHEVNSIIKQFEEARKMIKMMKKGKGFPGMPGMGAPPPPGRRR